jgi:sugar O-acyltransferase (sialic acid O-acetyltransferase NeuD family)
MKEIYLIGYSKLNLPIIFDLAYESFGISKFYVMKNISIDEDLWISINTKKYKYKMIEPNDHIKIKSESFFFGVTTPKVKTLVYEHFRDKYEINHSWFVNLIHPKSYLATSIELETGILVEPNVTISSQTKIGFGVTIRRGVCVGHHNIIEKYSQINPGVIISGNVHIGQNCTLGAGCIIRDSISIGDKSLIGMGSVVTQDIPSGVVAYGNPCKVIRDNE